MRGRPKSKNPLIFKSIGLAADNWEWQIYGSPKHHQQLSLESYSTGPENFGPQILTNSNRG